MDPIIQFILGHKSHAPWIVFSLIILAGLNIPISIDVVMVLTAFMAATLLPEYTEILFISILFGTYISASLCYWVGRIVGSRLLRIPYFSKLLPNERLKKLKAFYTKYGLLALMIGRFIPFGIRNCLFMTTGMSRLNFRSFLLRDALASTLWASTCFFSFYHLGQNFEALLSIVKTLNIYLFIAFGVTVIAFVCYKKYRKKQNTISSKVECKTKN